MFLHSAAASVVPTTKYITIPAQGGLHFYLDASAPPSYPGSGNVWYDLMDNLSPSVIRSAVSFTKDGQASYFTIPGGADGVDYMDRAISSTGNNYPAFNKGHLSAWVYKTGWGVSAQDQIFDFRGGTSNFNLFFNDFDTDLYAWVYTSDSGYPVTLRARLYNPSQADYHNQWIYLSMDWDGTTGGASNLKLYRNGVEVASDFDAGTTFLNAKSNIPTGIGGQGYLLPYPEQHDIFDGRIALMHFHTASLSAAEIQSNFNNLKSRFGL